MGSCFFDGTHFDEGNGAFSMNQVMAIKQAVPLLRVTDVARSILWYRGTLGFVGDPFPASPPHEFAILRHGAVELMLRRGSPPVRPKPRQYDWDVYLRREGEGFREVFAAFNARGIVTRRLERMPYGLAEFEITDPDGHVICLSQMLENANDLPGPTA
jgi:hypothetical protein